MDIGPTNLCISSVGHVTALSLSNYITSDVRMLVGLGSDHALVEVLSQRLPGGTEEDQETLIQDNPCSERHSTQAPPEYGSRETSSKQSECLVYLLTLKMGAVPCSETSVNMYRTARRHVPEECENIRCSVDWFGAVPGAVEACLFRLPYGCLFRRYKGRTRC